MTNQPQPSNDSQHGMLQTLREHTPAIVTNNAPRVVAALKMMGSIVMFKSQNKVFSTAGAFCIAANTISLLFSRKKTDEEKEKLRAETSADDEKNRGVVTDYATKLFQPHKYPIESCSSIAMMASSLWAASGIFGKGGFSAGRLIGGFLSFCSDANVVFTRERIGEPFSNPNKPGTIKYYTTEMKHRPVLLSSLFNISCDVVSVIGGAYERAKGKESNTLLVGAFLLAGNVFQALFVNKNDYNIEATANEAKKEDKTSDASEAKHSHTLTDNSEAAWQDRAAKAATPAMASVSY